MKDLIPKGTGDSRTLKSNISANTTFTEFLSMLRSGTLPIDIGAINAGGVQQMGTPLNKENLLPDYVAALLGLPQTDPQIRDALERLQEEIKVPQDVISWLGMRNADINDVVEMLAFSYGHSNVPVLLLKFYDKIGNPVEGVSVVVETSGNAGFSSSLTSRPGKSNAKGLCPILMVGFGSDDSKIAEKYFKYLKITASHPFYDMGELESGVLFNNGSDEIGVLKRNMTTLDLSNYVSFNNYVYLTESGSYTIPPSWTNGADAFIVGGGGGGGCAHAKSSYRGCGNAGGGGGGYVKTVHNINPSETVDIVIGAGGSGGSNSSSSTSTPSGSQGGSTSIKRQDGSLFSAEGGNGGGGGGIEGSLDAKNTGFGGAGGSGGGGGIGSLKTSGRATGTGGAGGTDGGSGGTGIPDDTAQGEGMSGGEGSGLSTRPFGDLSLPLCSSGGNGAVNSATNGGGGYGYYSNGNLNGSYYGCGGGGGTCESSENRLGGAGYQGVVILKKL